MHDLSRAVSETKSPLSYCTPEGVNVTPYVYKCPYIARFVLH
jgi:hypothetical protein